MNILMVIMIIAVILLFINDSSHVKRPWAFWFETFDTAFKDKSKKKRNIARATLIMMILTVVLWINHCIKF